MMVLLYGAVAVLGPVSVLCAVGAWTLADAGAGIQQFQL